MTGEDRTLVELLGEALRLRDDGATLDLDALCRAHPHHRAAIEDALGIAPLVDEMTQPADPLLGREIGGRYRIDARIGAGAMGAVYAATDRELGRRVAIKVVRGIAGDERALERFLREARALAALAHPNVVPVHDRGRDADGTAFLVMELVAGRSLAAILHDVDASCRGDPTAFHDARGVDPRGHETSWLRLCAGWCAALADGLAVAHAAGITHRDVKPSNVLVRDDGTPVLVDFGIAALGDARDAALTATGTLLGTPWYMSPEALRGDATPEPGLDVYGLTATLYHMLTLRPPYDGALPDVLRRIAEHDPPRASSLHRGLPRDLQAILDRGLARERRHRYATAAELGADLRAFLDHRPVRARPLSASTRVWRRVRRHPARAAAVAFGGAAVALFAVALPAWNAQAARASELAWRDVVRTVPPLLSIESTPEERARIPKAESDAAIALLERVLALRPSDLFSRLQLASLHLDRGERDRASIAMALLAEAAPSDYSAAVAMRYRDAGPAPNGSSPALDGLGAPTTTADLLIAGFHLLRARAFGDAEPLLRRAAQADGAALPAWIIALMARFDDRQDAMSACDEAERASLTLEKALGTETALTQLALGTVAVHRRQYRQAVAPLSRSLELQPLQYAAHHNLGLALHRLGELDAAEQNLARAATLRPWQWRATVELVHVLRTRGQFDRARARLAELRGDVLGVEPGRIELELGMVALDEAFTVDTSDRERLRASAAAAEAAFTEAGRRAAPVPAAAAIALRAEQGRLLARALRSDDGAGIVAAGLQYLAIDPTNVRALLIVSGWLPDGDPFRTFLDRLARELDRRHPLLERESPR